MTNIHALFKPCVILKMMQATTIDPEATLLYRKVQEAADAGAELLKLSPEEFALIPRGTPEPELCVSIPYGVWHEMTSFADDIRAGNYQQAEMLATLIINLEGTLKLNR
jgi:hypothetical protein